MHSPQGRIRRKWTEPGRTLGALLGLMLMVLMARLFMFSVASEETDLDHQRDFNANYKIFSLTLPEQITLCDEPVPLGELDVRERLDRELLVNTYWQSNSILAYKRSARWLWFTDHGPVHKACPTLPCLCR